MVTLWLFVIGIAFRVFFFFSKRAGIIVILKDKISYTLKKPEAWWQWVK
jgi:hypothetical protein